MTVRRRHDDAAGGRGDRHLRRVHRRTRTAGLAVEPVGERRAERLVDMQHQQHRQAKLRRQRAQHLEDRAGPPVEAPMATTR